MRIVMKYLKILFSQLANISIDSKNIDRISLVNFSSNKSKAIIRHAQNNIANFTPIESTTKFKHIQCYPSVSLSLRRPSELLPCHGRKQCNNCAELVVKFAKFGILEHDEFGEEEQRELKRDPNR